MVGPMDGKAVQVHGELPEVAAHPGPAGVRQVRGQRSRYVARWHTCGGRGGVSLGEPLAEAQVEQVGPQGLILLPAEELGLPLALLVQPQGLPELRLNAAQLEPEQEAPSGCRR